MLDAGLLIADADKATGILGPWFPREGDDAWFTLEILAVHNATLTVTPWQKNTNEAGDGSPHAGGTLSGASAGLVSDEYYGLRQMVRFHYELEVTDPEAGRGWVLFRMVRPSWSEAMAVA